MYLRTDDRRYEETRKWFIFVSVLLLINLFATFVLFLSTHTLVTKSYTDAVRIEEIERTIDISSRELGLESREEEPPVIPVNQEDKELLARVIYQEAGGNECCDECRRRVADVVLNRVEDPRFPNDIRSVLTAPRQYGLYSETGVVWADRASEETEKEAVARAYRIAEEVLTGKHSELYGQGYIWQAEFKQGSEQLYHCGIYFGR